MDNMNLYAVILTFPQNIENELENLRVKYNKSVYEIVPHITLKMPFKLLADRYQIIKTLNKIASETEKFEIEMNGVSYFDGAINSVAYIVLKDISSVKDLHTKIVYSLKELVEDFGEVNFELEKYIPHATIGESIPNEEIQIVKQELSSYKPSYKIPINSFSLYYSEDNIVWKPVEKFNLK